MMRKRGRALAVGPGRRARCARALSRTVRAGARCMGEGQQRAPHERESAAGKGRPCPPLGARPINARPRFQGRGRAPSRPCLATPPTTGPAATSWATGPDRQAPAPVLPSALPRPAQNTHAGRMGAHRKGAPPLLQPPITCSSASVGFWPSERMTVPSSLVVIVPSPSLSKRAKASYSWRGEMCGGSRGAGV